MLFDAIDPSSSPPFAKFSPPPFKSHVIGKAFILNKNEGNNKKVENKVSGRVKTQVYFFMRTLAYAQSYAQPWKVYLI